MTPMTTKPNRPPNTDPDQLPPEVLNLARRIRQIVNHNGLYNFHLVVFDEHWYLEAEPGKLERLS